MRLFLAGSLLISSFVAYGNSELREDKPLKVSKYLIKPGSQSLSLPQDASIVSAAVHEGQLSLWAAYTPGSQASRQTPVLVVPSDESFPFEGNMRFIATIVDGTQAWHVFSDN